MYDKVSLQHHAFAPHNSKLFPLYPHMPRPFYPHMPRPFTLTCPAPSLGGPAPSLGGPAPSLTSNWDRWGSQRATLSRAPFSIELSEGFGSSKSEGQLNDALVQPVCVRTAEAMCSTFVQLLDITHREII